MDFRPLSKVNSLCYFGNRRNVDLDHCIQIAISLSQYWIVNNAIIA